MYLLHFLSSFMKRKPPCWSDEKMVAMTIVLSNLVGASVYARAWDLITAKNAWLAGWSWRAFPLPQSMSFDVVCRLTWDLKEPSLALPLLLFIFVDTVLVVRILWLVYWKLEAIDFFGWTESNVCHYVCASTQILSLEDYSCWLYFDWVSQRHVVYVWGNTRNFDGEVLLNVYLFNAPAVGQFLLNMQSLYTAHLC